MLDSFCIRERQRGRTQAQNVPPLKDFLPEARALSISPLEQPVFIAKVKVVVERSHPGTLNMLQVFFLCVF